MKKYVCPNKRCETYKLKEWQLSKYRQGELCEKCQELLNNSEYQKITCNSCGVIYEIREKINKKEEDYVERGMCIWCYNRKLEEDRLIKEGRMSEEERVKPINMNKVINNIFNKPKLE